MTRHVTTTLARQDAGQIPEHLAQHAFEALINEALLTPKPGLIDLRGGNAHHDMSLGLMCRSALTLKPWFNLMARRVTEQSDTFTQRRTLGALGREAEQAMLDATNGINTHRGAIWALGLLVAGAAKAVTSASGQLTPYAIARHAAMLALCVDPNAPQATGYKGEMARRRYRVGGAKAQAQAGFPHVLRVGLPTLHRSRHSGQSETSARLDTLLALIATLDDTCLLARGGLHALYGMQFRARRTLTLGGSSTPNGWAALSSLNAWANRKRLSPGGAADLLAATLFLDDLCNTSPTCRSTETWKN